MSGGWRDEKEIAKKIQEILYTYQEKKKRLTVFPEVHRTLISSPRISKTSPSIQASSESSNQTRDPTTRPVVEACKCPKVNKYAHEVKRIFRHYLLIEMDKWSMFDACVRWLKQCPKKWQIHMNYPVTKSTE